MRKSNQAEALRMVQGDEALGEVLNSLPPGLLEQVEWYEAEGRAPQLDRDSRGARIVMPALPVPLEDASNVAHELLHLLMDTEGFPSVAPAASLGEAGRQLAGTFNSLFQDPLVLGRLRNVGFDLRRGHLEDRAALREAQESARAMIEINSGLQLMVVFEFCASILEWNVLRDSEEPVDDDGVYVGWARSAFPTLANSADQLLAVIREAGFDNPVAMGAAMSEAVGFLGISEYLSEPRETGFVLRPEG